MTTIARRISLAFVLIATIAMIVVLEMQKPARLGSQQSEESQALNSQLEQAIQGQIGDDKARQAERADKAARLPTAPELVNPDGYINTDKISISDLVGKKVILVDFWTYSCINCQRTIPYLNAWYEKYHDQGLEIIGVHTPEFSFEKDYANVAAAVKKFGIRYPVVLDNEYATWDAYANRYWPRKYLIDIDGFVAYDHIGEGGYDETEKEIQTLLNERIKLLGLQGKVDNPLTEEKPAPSDANLSDETYFGSNRNAPLAHGPAGKNVEQDFTTPSAINEGKLYLGGKWKITPEYAEEQVDGASTTFRYHAAEVYIVAAAASPVHAKVLVDGKPISASMMGEDIDKKTGEVTIQEDRLYKLIKDQKGYSSHVIQLIFDGAGVQAYTFTFG